MNQNPEFLARTQDLVEKKLVEGGIVAHSDVDTVVNKTEEVWISQNGAKVVARAWTDPEFKRLLLEDGRAAAEEMGFEVPKFHRQIVVQENTDSIHNVICCSLCSCTAFSLVGMAPGWYKDVDYRARITREARTVLREMGLDLPEHIKIRVWDTTTETRYMVLPYRPPATEHLNQEQLAALVTQNSMIGVARLEHPFNSKGL